MHILFFFRPRLKGLLLNQMPITANLQGKVRDTPARIEFREKPIRKQFRRIQLPNEEREFKGLLSAKSASLAGRKAAPENRDSSGPQAGTPRDNFRGAAMVLSEPAGERDARIIHSAYQNSFNFSKAITTRHRMSLAPTTPTKMYQEKGKKMSQPFSKNESAAEIKAAFNNNVSESFTPRSSSVPILRDRNGNPRFEGARKHFEQKNDHLGHGCSVIHNVAPVSSTCRLFWDGENTTQIHGTRKIMHETPPFEAPPLPARRASARGRGALYRADSPSMLHHNASRIQAPTCDFTSRNITPVRGKSPTTLKPLSVSPETTNIPHSPDEIFRPLLSL